MEHPMQPTPDEIRALVDEAYKLHYSTYRDEGITSIATRLAYAAGADAELRACCEYLELEERIDYAALLRADRRPKPPSLKQQALEALEQVDGWGVGSESHLPIHDDLVAGVDVIRRALESIPDSL